MCDAFRMVGLDVEFKDRGIINFCVYLDSIYKALFIDFLEIRKSNLLPTNALSDAKCRRSAIVYE